MIDKRLVDLTVPFTQTDCVSIQTINKKIKDYDTTSIFKALIPSLDFAAIFFTGMILNFAILFIFSFFKKKFSFADSAIKNWTFCFAIFIWFLIEILHGNMNLSNVIIDTSDLLYTKEKL